jgi:hypothetical protein
VGGYSGALVEAAEQTEAARRYLARGWSVLPLRGRDKRPLIGWDNLQNERPSEEDETMSVGTPEGPPRQLAGDLTDRNGTVSAGKPSDCTTKF